MVKIVDSTLREGEQTPGVCFSLEQKLEIAKLLDKTGGVRLIEAGHPRVSPNIKKAVTAIAGAGLNSIVGAHARSNKKDIDEALDCGVGFIGIFYCVRDERLNQFGTDINKAIGRITDSIIYAKEQNPNLIIRYTPEDATRSDFDQVILASSEAVKAGADIISIADTTGYMLPDSVASLVDASFSRRSTYCFMKSFRDSLRDNDVDPQIAFHAHNDRGLAFANALDAIRAGVEIIDTSVLGLGERTGIVDLATLMGVLNLEFNYGEEWDLSVLPQLYEVVSKYSKIPTAKSTPFAGEYAFTHCAGVHTNAARKNPAHYQSVDPALFGREMDVSLDHMSGMSSIDWALDKGNISLDDSNKLELLAKVKLRGEEGRISINEFVRMVRELNRKSPEAQEMKDYVLGFMEAQNDFEVGDDNSC
jgi:2-isopropylmalate synthase